METVSLPTGTGAVRWRALLPSRPPGERKRWRRTGGGTNVRAPSHRGSGTCPSPHVRPPAPHTCNHHRSPTWRPWSPSLDVAVRLLGFRHRDVGGGAGGDANLLTNHAGDHVISPLFKWSNRHFRLPTGPRTCFVTGLCAGSNGARRIGPILKEVDVTVDK